MAYVQTNPEKPMPDWGNKHIKAPYVCYNLRSEYMKMSKIGILAIKGQIGSKLAIALG